MSASTSKDETSRVLFRIRFVHTAAWVVFASATLAIPAATALGALRAATWFSLIVTVEVAVLLVNGMRCPLTGIAARYTADRSDNFDIFLPAWLARYNKLIFGTIFVASETYLMWRWLGPLA